MFCCINPRLDSTHIKVLKTLYSVKHVMQVLVYCQSARVSSGAHHRTSRLAQDLTRVMTHLQCEYNKVLETPHEACRRLTEFRRVISHPRPVNINFSPR